MHLLDESHIFIFLVQMLVLLGAARTLGALCEEIRIPAIAGEISAGVFLGPTLLGRYFPEIQAWIFPGESIQWTMLETISWLGVFFLLLSSGFHVDVPKALKKGRATTSVGIVGVVVPLLIGLPVFATLEPRLWGPGADRVTFTLFLSVASSITAIAVVARVLKDLKLTETEDGNLALSACAVNDIFGWLLFTVVITLATAAELDAPGLTLTTLGIISFIAACIIIGSQVMEIAARWVCKTSLEQPTAMMTLVVTSGLLCGAITQWLGIHAVLGFFLAGTMAGSADGITPKLRESLSDSLHAIFVPIFFATLGLKLDFVTGMEFKVTALFTAVAIGGKFIGAWIGARMAGLKPSTAVLLGFIFTPGGAMEIVVGALALELDLISKTVFVAIVFAALISSILVGPLIAWWLRRQRDEPT